MYNLVLFQGLLTHMFRELLSYCITSIESSGSYSLCLSVLPDETRLFVNFCAGNSLHSMCLAVFPGCVFSPSALIPHLGSLFPLVEQDVHLLFLSGFSHLLGWAISRVLPQHKKICSTPKFDPDDLERVLLIPSVQVLDRFDFRSVLDFLLMRLRSACGSSWLSALPEFQKVMFHFPLFHFLSEVLFCIFRLFCQFVLNLV